MPARPTDERKGEEDEEEEEEEGVRRERPKKVHEGMERKEETQESEGEKDYFWSRVVQHTLLCFFQLFSSLHLVLR